MTLLQNDFSLYNKEYFNHSLCNLRFDYFVPSRLKICKNYLEFNLRKRNVVSKGKIFDLLIFKHFFVTLNALISAFMQTSKFLGGG